MKTRHLERWESMASRRNAINKGRAFQKRVLALFQETFGLNNEQAWTPFGSQPGPDLIFTREAQERVGLTIECKNQRRIGILAALEQVKANLYTNTLPAVVFHVSKPGEKTNWITVPLDHYLELRKNERSQRGINTRDPSIEGVDRGNP